MAAHRRVFALLAVLLVLSVASTRAGRPFVLEDEDLAYEDFAPTGPLPNEANAYKLVSWLMGPVSRLPASKPVVPETETMEEMIRAVQCSRLRAALRDYQAAARRQYEHALGGVEPRLASKFSANNPRQPQPQSQSLSQQRATAADESLYMDLQHRMERVIDAERRHASALAAAGDPARGVLDSILTLRAHLLRGAEAVELQHAPGDDWLPEDDRLPYVEDEGVTYRVARKGGQEERERGQVPEDPDLVAYPYDEGETEPGLVVTSAGSVHLSPTSDHPTTTTTHTTTSGPLYILVNPFSYAASALRELAGRIELVWAGAHHSAAAIGSADTSSEYDYRQYLYDLAYADVYSDPETQGVTEELRNGRVKSNGAAGKAYGAQGMSGLEDEGLSVSAGTEGLAKRQMVVRMVEEQPTWGAIWSAWLGAADAEIAAAAGAAAASHDGGATAGEVEDDCEWQLGLVLLGALLLAVAAMMVAFARSLRSLRRAMHPRAESGLVVPFLVESEDGGSTQGYMLLDEEALQQAASGKGFQPATLVSGSFGPGGKAQVTRGEPDKERAAREWATQRASDQPQ